MELSFSDKEVFKYFLVANDCYHCANIISLYG